MRFQLQNVSSSSSEKHSGSHISPILSNSSNLLGGRRSFDVVALRLRCHFHLKTEFFLFIFTVLVYIIGGGAAKSVPEGLF